MIRFAGSKSNLFLDRVGLRQGCPLLQILIITFIDRVTQHSLVAEGVRFGDFRILSLLFADDVVLLVPSSDDLWLELDRFTAEWEAAGMQIGTFKSEAMVLSQKRVHCPLRVREEVLLVLTEGTRLQIEVAELNFLHWEADLSF